MTVWVLYLPRRHPCFSFLLEADQSHGHNAAGRNWWVKNPIGKRTHDLQACSAVRFSKTPTEIVEFLKSEYCLLICVRCVTYREHCLDWLLLASVRAANECSAVLLVNLMSQYQYQWSRGSVAVHLLGLRVRILLMTWMSICCDGVVCCKVVCVGLITRPEKSYQVWCVWVWW
jgi:hypothetical protein